MFKHTEKSTGSKGLSVKCDRCSKYVAYDKAMTRNGKHYHSICAGLISSNERKVVQ